MNACEERHNCNSTRIYEIRCLFRWNRKYTPESLRQQSNYYRLNNCKHKIRSSPHAIYIKTFVSFFVHRIVKERFEGLFDL